MIPSPETVPLLLRNTNFVQLLTIFLRAQLTGGKLTPFAATEMGVFG